MDDFFNKPTTVEISKKEQEHWDELSQDKRQSYEQHASYLWRRGYLDVEPRSTAIRIAWMQREIDKLDK